MALMKYQCINWLIKSYFLIEKFKTDAHKGSKKLIKLMRNEIFRIEPAHAKMFFFRNFSNKVNFMAKSKI